MWNFKCTFIYWINDSKNVVKIVLTVPTLSDAEFLLLLETVGKLIINFDVCILCVCGLLLSLCCLLLLFEYMSELKFLIYSVDQKNKKSSVQPGLWHYSGVLAASSCHHRYIITNHVVQFRSSCRLWFGFYGGWVKETGGVWFIVLRCPILVGTWVQAMVPWSVGRKMSRRPLWMSLPQDPWALPQQSVASNRSAIVGEKGNSTLAHRHSGPLSAWSVPDLTGSTQRSLFGKKGVKNGFVCLHLVNSDRIFILSLEK